MTVTNALRRLVARTPSNAESFFLPLLAQANVRQEETLFSELIVAVRELQLTRMAVEETLLQCCIFDGYPAALEGFRRLNRFWPANTGELREEYSARQLAEWRRRGAALCQLIYGESTDKLITDVQALSPDLSSWFLVEGYGRVLSRPGLYS
ncbi:hypothetical protein H8D51_03980 [bacterium]|nr:hypothetical protein [bacterium]